MLKKIIVDYYASLRKNPRYAPQYDFKFTRKNVSHLKRLKKTATTKNKPKIVENTMTNSCPQSRT